MLKSISVIIYPMLIKNKGNKKQCITRRVAPYTPTRSCVHIGVLKKRKRNKIGKIRNNENLEKSGKQSLPPSDRSVYYVGRRHMYDQQ